MSRINFDSSAPTFRDSTTLPAPAAPANSASAPVAANDTEGAGSVAPSYTTVRNGPEETRSGSANAVLQHHKPDMPPSQASKALAKLVAAAPLQPGAEIAEKAELDIEVPTPQPLRGATIDAQKFLGLFAQEDAAKQTATLGLIDSLIAHEKQALQKFGVPNQLPNGAPTAEAVSEEVYELVGTITSGFSAQIQNFDVTPPNDPPKTAIFSNIFLVLNPDLLNEAPKTPSGPTDMALPPAFKLPTGNAFEGMINAINKKKDVSAPTKTNGPPALEGTSITKEFASSDIENMNVHALVQWVIRQAYIGTTEDLRHMAAKVLDVNNQKKAVREELAEMREFGALFAHLDDDEVLNPPFKSNIPGNHGGSGGVQTIDGGQGAEGGKPKRAAITTTTTEVTAINTDFSKDTRVKKAGVKYGSKDPGSINKAGNDYYEKILTQINSMSPEQQAALLDYFEKNGLEFKCDVLNYKNSWYRETYTFRPEAGESLAEFMGRAISEGASNIRSKVGKEKSGEWRINSVEFKVPNWPSSLEVSEPLVGSTTSGQGAYQPQGGAGAGSGGSKDPGVLDTKAKLNAEMKRLEDEMNSLGEDGQLFNLDLQNILQMQQQLLQTMTNVSKIVHDMALSVARNIG